MRLLISPLLLLLSCPFFAQIPSALIYKHGLESLDEFVEFLRLPNVAPDPEQLEPNIQWLERAFAQRAFTTLRLPTGGLDLLLAERTFEGAQKTVLFYVQVDGQPVDPAAWAQDDPFEPVLKEQDAEGNWQTIPWERLDLALDPEWRIFARSASDAKGPINMFLAAIDIVDVGGLVVPNFNIKVIMDTEEELGSPHLTAAVDQYRDELAADYLVILDGPMHQTLRPTLVFGARGIIDLSLTTFGPRLPQHSGHYGNYAPNPALMMAQLLASMKDERGRVTLPGFYDGVRIGPKEKEALAAIPDSEEEIRDRLGIARPDAVAASLQEAIQYPSLNIRGLRSAWVGEEVRTIVPATATAEIDIRLVKESDPDRLLELIRDHIQEQGFHFIEGEVPTEVERRKFPKLISWKAQVAYRAFRTELDHPLGQWLSRAIVNAQGEMPIRIPTHGGSIPISPFVHTLDVPAVAVPLVNPDNNQHSPNENIRLGSYFDGILSCVGILSTPLKTN